MAETVKKIQFQGKNFGSPENRTTRNRYCLKSAFPGGKRYPSNRLKASETLVPPNPKELLKAYRNSACRAVFGT